MPSGKEYSVIQRENLYDLLSIRREFEKGSTREIDYLIKRLKTSMNPEDVTQVEKSLD